MQVLEFQQLDVVAAAVQNAGEPSTGLAFLDQYSIIVLGDLAKVRDRCKERTCPETCTGIDVEEILQLQAVPTQHSVAVVT